MVSGHLQYSSKPIGSDLIHGLVVLLLSSVACIKKNVISEFLKYLELSNRPRK